MAQSLSAGAVEFGDVTRAELYPLRPIGSMSCATLVALAIVAAMAGSAMIRTSCTPDPEGSGALPSLLDQCEG